MRRCALTLDRAGTRVRRAGLLARATAAATALSFLACLAGAGSAQAVVVDMNASGQTVVPYSASAASGYYGVDMVQGNDSDPTAAGAAIVKSVAPCVDPALTFDFTLPDNGLCSHGGPVIHSNETFSVAWDQYHRDWSKTRQYVEQFLRDVADGSGTLTSPYALTSQYTAGGIRAANDSVYGGGCIDYGSFVCNGTNVTGSGQGQPYPANGCAVSGTDKYTQGLDGSYGGLVDFKPNDVCLTDAQLRAEVVYMTQSAFSNPVAGRSLEVVLRTPHGVEDCLDAAGEFCSANSDAAARFCSYHSQVDVNGTEVTYVVLPWAIYAGCDEPDIPALSDPPSTQEMALDAGERLVSPLSRSQIAAAVNPAMTGWFALDGAEVDDNGCTVQGNGNDKVTVGISSQNPYFLQREFNNGGLLISDPMALNCAPFVNINPQFVLPSALAAGSRLALDGSVTESSLVVPGANYAWSFGDGTSGQGPSVVHSYRNGGSYPVKLTVTDRGGYTASITQSLTVTGPAAPAPVSGGGSGSTSALSVKLTLLPQSLAQVIVHGLAVRVTSNAPADGVALIKILSSVARKAGFTPASGKWTVVARGTVNQQIKAGTVTLHLHVSSSVASKLKRLVHPTLGLELDLVGSQNHRVTVTSGGTY